MAEANEIQWCWSREFEACIGSHPRRKLLCQLYVPAHVMPQALHAVVANHEPQLQRPKPPAQGDLPVAIVDHSTRFCSPVAQVFWQYAQRANERCSVAHIEAVAIKIREHPLMRIETVAVGQLDAVVRPAKFRAEGGRARHSRINVQPETVFTRNCGDLAHWIDRVR